MNNDINRKPFDNGEITEVRENPKIIQNYTCL